MPVEGPCVTFQAPPASPKFLCYVPLPCGVWRYELREIKTPTPAARHVIKWAQLNEQTAAEGKISAISIPLHGKTEAYTFSSPNTTSYLSLFFQSSVKHAYILKACANKSTRVPLNTAHLCSTTASNKMFRNSSGQH